MTFESLRSVLTPETLIGIVGGALALKLSHQRLIAIALIVASLFISNPLLATVASIVTVDLLVNLIAPKIGVSMSG
ncbi:MAG: hypothetical protein QXM03_12615 [Metallosphaera sp.]|uniref:hypothetical protein n=1 Tax=Metallosphaera sp. TaxID=2020860 RepID=UPI0031656A1B